MSDLNEEKQAVLDMINGVRDMGEENAQDEIPQDKEVGELVVEVDK